jgi:hypothetical protein
MHLRVCSRCPREIVAWPPQAGLAEFEEQPVELSPAPFCVQPFDEAAVHRASVLHRELLACYCKEHKTTLTHPEWGGFVLSCVLLGALAGVLGLWPPAAAQNKNGRL